MEISHLLLFTAVASSLIVLWQSLRTRNRRLGFNALSVLTASLVAWLLARPIAGWLAASVWCALLVIPAYRHHRMRPGGAFYRPLMFRVTPVVLTLIILNLAAFAVEIRLGGPTESRVLQQLGWLETDSVLYTHEYWRLLSALFLHFGALHLVVNMYALLVLGPGLEREMGSAAFAVCYLLSGIGSTLAIVFLTKWHVLAPVELVGASGCIMGIVGAWAGFLLRDRHLPEAQQRLRILTMIVVLQIAFDLITPRVSMSAHLAGLACGLVLGLIVPVRRSRHIIRSR